MSFSSLWRKVADQASKRARTRSTSAIQKRSVPVGVERLETRMVPAGLTANQRLVAQAYRDLLQREADAVGMSVFTTALDKRTMTPEQMALTIEKSPEYLNKKVQRLYSDLLHRSADPMGLSDGIALLKQGGTPAQLKAKLAGSSEYFQKQGGGTNAGFLRAFYRDVLGRAIDASGQAAFGQLLAKGVGRGQIAETIFASAEHQQKLVHSLFNQFLHRNADPSGLNNFTNALQHGIGEHQVAATILASKEYASRT